MTPSVCSVKNETNRRLSVFRQVSSDRIRLEELVWKIKKHISIVYVKVSLVYIYRVERRKRFTTVFVTIINVQVVFILKFKKNHIYKLSCMN